MNRTGRHHLRALAGLTCLTGLTLAVLSGGSFAQTPFPSKPVKIIVGFPAGGPLDAHARLPADRLGQLLGQPITVDYKAGAGGSVGADFVAKSEPDGYTLLMAHTGTMVIDPAIYPKNPYQTLRDFAPIARTATQPLAALVTPRVPANNLQEFIALAKTNPQAAQHVKQGKLRALAVTSREPNPALPETPTMTEAGPKGLEFMGFYGVLAPNGTPTPVVERLSAAFKVTLETPDVRGRMVAQGADPAFLCADDFGKFLAAGMPRWANAVQDSGARLD